MCHGDTGETITWDQQIKYYAYGNGVTGIACTTG